MSKKKFMFMFWIKKTLRIKKNNEQENIVMVDIKLIVHVFWLTFFGFDNTAQCIL